MLRAVDEVAGRPTVEPVAGPGGWQPVPVHGAAPAYRLSYAERDAVAARLRTAVGEGRITLDELEDRLRVVYGARSAAELLPVTADLPPSTEELQAVAKAGRRRRRKAFNAHLVPYLSVNGFLWMIWALTGHGFPWPLFPMGGWGIGLASHAAVAFGDHAEADLARAARRQRHRDRRR